MFRHGEYRDWRTSWYAISNWRRMWSGVESGSSCIMLTDQQSSNGNWWDWVWMATGRSGFETVVVKQCPFMRSERFSNVKSTAYIALELVGKVHRLAVSMGSYGVSEIGARAGESAGRTVNGAGLDYGGCGWLAEVYIR